MANRGKVNGTKRAKEASAHRRTARSVRPGPAAVSTLLEDSLMLQRALENPDAASPQAILALQRTAGNRAVSRLIQTKPMVGPAGDRYEREADRVADQVMSMPASVSGSWRRSMIDPQRSAQPSPLIGPAVIQLAWESTDNPNLTSASNTNIQTLKELVEGVDVMPGRARTIVPKRGSTHFRIDMQGSVDRNGEKWANIQCQIGEDSIAGVVCPFYLDLAKVREGLTKALDQEDILEWQEEEEEEIEGSPYIKNLLEEASNAGLEISDFQDYLDEVIQENTSYILSLYPESLHDEVKTELKSINLQAVLASYSGVPLSDRYNSKKWEIDFRSAAKSFVIDEITERVSPGQKKY